MNIRRTIVVLVVLSIIVVAENDVYLTLMSDIHYDPLYGSPGAYGPCTDSSYSTVRGTPNCDAPLELVTNAINDAINLETNSSLFLMTGDWVRHDMAAVPEEMVPAFSTVAKLVSRFRGHVVPLPNFAGALGNNDFVPDYHFNLSNPTHPLLHNLTEVLRNHSVMNADEAPSFAKCGYYRRDVPNTTLTVVVMNTLIWSTSLNPPLDSNVTDPCGQIAWLKTVLNEVQATGRRAYLLSHIPPTVNLYGVVKDGVQLEDAIYWHSHFQIAYKELVSKFKEVIAVQLFGHTHQFSFLADMDMGVPLFIVPSVTPVFGNNPSYFVAKADADTWTIKAIEQRHLTESAEWAFVSPDQATFLSGVNLSSKSLNQLASSLAIHPSTFTQFIDMHSGGIRKKSDFLWNCASEHCKRIVSCSMMFLRVGNISKCIATEETLLTRSVNVAVYVMFAFGVLIAFMSLVRLLYYRRELANDEADKIVLSDHADEEME